MNTIKQYLAQLKQSVAWVLKNPGAARKAAVRVVAHIALVWGAVAVAFPQVQTEHAGVFAAVTGFLTSLVNFLESAAVITVTDSGTPQ